MPNQNFSTDSNGSARSVDYRAHDVFRQALDEERRLYLQRGRDRLRNRGTILRRHDVARMAREDPPPIPYVVEGLVVRGLLTTLAGKPGIAKSLLAEVLGAGVASGQDEAGFRCRAGRVLIVDAENGEHEIHRRIRALRMPPGVAVIEAVGFDLRTDLDALEEELAWHCPTFLILDSFRSLWGGDENDSGEVARVLDPLRNVVREWDVGALLLHHTTKSGNDYRGSSAIAAGTELGFTLARSEGDPDPTRRFLECWKSRPVPEPATRWLSLTAEAGMVLVSEAEAHSPGKPGLPAREAVTQQVLAALGEHGSLKLADLARLLDRSRTDGTLRRALDGLEQRGDVRHAEGAWALTRHGANRATPLVGGTLAHGWQGGTPTDAA